MTGTTATPPRPAAARRRRSRPPFVAVVEYTLRGCFGLRRILGLLLPCAAIVLFGLLSTAAQHDSRSGFSLVAAHGLFGLLIPIACLVIGDAVLGAEIRGGTFPFTWLSPVRGGVIVVGRALGGWLVALITVVPATALAAVVGQAPTHARPIALATAVTAAAYVALFILIGCVTRRAAVWSLAVVFFVERLLGGVLSGVAQLSPMWEGQSIYTGLADRVDFDAIREGIPSGNAAIVRLAIVTTVCLVVASWRLRHLRLAGSAD